MVRQYNVIAALAALSLIAGAATAETAAPAAEQTGRADWYGEAFDGRLTASGERFDMFRLTAASPTLPIGSMVQVTNLKNGRTVTVRINDRRAQTGDCVIVLSKAAATSLEMVGQTSGVVKVKRVG